ncbi:MAG: UDP-3-O-acyl-N-acetylglucosamine deacetylase, partial [Phycisphaerales bacterium]
AEGGAGVQTVEHLMSALAAFGITDALLMVEGPEIPILDGSAAPFAAALSQPGVILEGAGAGDGPGPIVVRERIEVTEGNARIVAEPWPTGFVAVFELDYGPGAPLPKQTAEFNVLPGGASAAAYCTEIAPARTFCTEQEAMALRAAGLFGHLTAGDIPVYGAGGMVEGAARFVNEPARHKVLDLIGDLALAGRPIVGRITATRAGHALNHALARALLAHAPLP